MSTMECLTKREDLSEDEELAELRKAALATLKVRASKKSEIQEIHTISKVITSSENRLNQEQNNFQYNGSRRGNHQFSRMGRVFPKGASSNLIVITPIGGDDDSQQSKGLSKVLPQKKWFKADAEDSSSPKTYRKTGPTRFNRHESSSDSDDSEMDISDNSYSNETILQDEPRVYFNQNADESSIDNTLSDDFQDAKPSICSDLISDPDKESELNKTVDFAKEDIFAISEKETKFNKSIERAKEDIFADSVEDSEPAKINDCKNEDIFDLSDLKKPVVQNKYVLHSNLKSMKQPVLPVVNIVKSEPIPHPSVRTEITWSSADTAKNKDPAQTNHNSCMSEVKSKEVKLSPNDLRLALKKKHTSSESNSDLYDSVRQENEFDSKAALQRKDRFSRFKSRDHSSSSDSENESSKTSLRPNLNKHNLSPVRSNHDRFSRTDNNVSSNVVTSTYKRRRSNSPQCQNRRNNSNERGSSRQSSDHAHKSDTRNKDLSRQSRRRDYPKSPNKRNSKADNDYNNTKSRDLREDSKRLKSYDRFSPTSRSSSSDSSSRPLPSISSVVTSVKSPVKSETSSGSDARPKTGSFFEEVTSVKQASVAESTKRVPVHMRLGAFPRKKIVQVAKNVEAAFVNTSSDEEDQSNKFKKENFRVTTELYTKKNEASKRIIQRGPDRIHRIR